MPKERLDNPVKNWLLVLFLAMVFAAQYVNSRLEKPIDQGMDIYYSWVEGRRLLLGENPYSRILYRT